MLCGLDQLMERKEGGGMYLLWVPLTGDVRTLMMDETHASRLYTNEIVTRHGVYVTLQKVLGTRLDMSTTYHPPTDGQSEHTIQTCEDVLRVCMSDFGGSWDVHLLLAEFSYNNSYHSSIRCALFEAWYRRKCRSHVLWSEIGEIRSIGPELVQETTNKNYLADTNLHVHFEEIKVDKTLRFVEEPVEIVDCGVKSLKRSRIPIVKSIGTRSEVMRIS
ncbi:putative reverse transcriptase domain-containing protein [Tanacetum coccineum]